MTNIEVTYNIIFKAKAPFNKATYEERTLEEAVELEQNVDFDDILEILNDGNYDKDSVKFNIEVDTDN